MTFRVGMKVVCINDEGNWWNGAQYVRFGTIYTISDMRSEDLFLIGDHQIGPGTGLKLAEVRLDSHHWLSATRFRPIVSRKTSIEIFTRMLTDQQVDA